VDIAREFLAYGPLEVHRQSTNMLKETRMRRRRMEELRISNGNAMSARERTTDLHKEETLNAINLHMT
jgi:hypothetical protein